MRKAVRVIIIKDEKLLVMHRNKFGDKYDTLPGGNVEVGETNEQALQREVQEETSLIFSNPRLVCVEHAGDPYGDQFIYIANYVSGEPQLAPDSEESIINKLGKNLYEPGWLPINELVSTRFLSEQLKQFIIDGHNNSWPESAVEITTN